MEQITREVYLFVSIMQQNVIENELNREYAPLQLSNQVWPLNLRFMVQMTCTQVQIINEPEQLAPTCARHNHQSRRNKHRREYSGSNQPDAALNVSRD